jgi:hypothetical protein
MYVFTTLHWNLHLRASARATVKRVRDQSKVVYVVMRKTNPEEPGRWVLEHLGGDPTPPLYLRLKTYAAKEFRCLTGSPPDPGVPFPLVAERKEGIPWAYDLPEEKKFPPNTHMPLPKVILEEGPTWQVRLIGTWTQEFGTLEEAQVRFAQLTGARGKPDREVCILPSLVPRFASSEPTAHENVRADPPPGFKGPRVNWFL